MFTSKFINTYTQLQYTCCLVQRCWSEDQQQLAAAAAIAAVVVVVVVVALRYGTRSQGISQFYLHIERSSANGMNDTCLCLPSRSWYSFTDPGWMDGWVGLGWLHTEINVRHRELNPDTVAHLTNRARRRFTSLIEANAITTTPDCQ